MKNKSETSKKHSIKPSTDAQTSSHLSPKQLEGLRDEVAHYLLSKMSAGSQFQYALDRMLQLCALYTEDELQELLPKKKKKSGGGF